MKTRLYFIVFCALVLVGCGGSQPDVPPTQTPVFVVVTGDTPLTTQTPEVTATPGEQPTEDASTPSIVPTPFICSSAGVVEQAFENGRMFWVGRTDLERCKEEHSFIPGTGEVWVAIFDEDGEGGEWLVFVDTFDEDTEEAFDPELEAPDEDLIQPERGFGKVWRERLTDEQREALGWATSQEFPHVTTYRYEVGGFVNDDGEFVERPGIHALTSLGEELFLFDEGGLTFSYEAAN